MFNCWYPVCKDLHLSIEVMNCSGTLKEKLTLVLIFIPLWLGGQFYSQGEDPSFVKWDQIQTDNFKLIYPRDFYKEANRFANLLEYYRPYTSSSLNHSPSKIPVLIHTQSIRSNGFVSWAPKRMEIVALPDQGQFNQDWLELLALHEYRHVVQIDKCRQGITFGLSWFFGEMITGATSAYMTRWFLEGDAVVTETALSSTGRGRLPSFDMELRAANLDSMKNFTYDQVFMGSYKYSVPNLYQYGYHMVSYARIKNGPGFWSRAIDYAARNPYLLAPLSLYCMKQTGMNREKLYNHAMDSVRYIWQEKKEKRPENDCVSIISKPSKHFRQYKWPQPLSDKSIIALKTGIDLLDQIVHIDSSGNEKRLHVIGNSTGLDLSASDNYVIWDEVVGDPRWEGRSYSVIKSLAMHTGKEKTLGRKTRYFSPDILSDESKIVAIEADKNNNNFLIVLQFPRGNLLCRIPSPENRTLQYPRWINPRQVLLVAFNGKEKSLERVNIETGEWEILFRAGNMDIAEPACWKDYILFRASYGGTDNVFALDKKGTIFQVTSAPFGAFYPSVTSDSSNLAYSNYTSNGFELVEIPLDTSRWIQWLPQNGSAFHFPWPKKLQEQEPAITDRESAPFRFYDKTRYRKATHLFKFHSWLPFFLDLDENNLSLDYKTVKPGFIAFSQNLLSTALTTLSYRYDHGYHIFKSSFTYRGWYPVFNCTAEIGGPVEVLPYPEGIDIPEIRSERKEFMAKIYVPLFFSQNKYFKLLQPQLEYEWSNTLYYNKIFKNGIGFLHGRLYFYRYLKYTYRDLYPKWGQYFSFSFTGSPGDEDQFGKMGSAQASFYFPGIVNHHSFNIIVGYQKQWPLHFYLPVNNIPFPRGFKNFVSEEFSRFSVNYSFPFFYPEYSLSWFLYVQRLKANFFYDFSYGEKIQTIKNGILTPYTGKYSSTGIELYMDFHLFRTLFPLQAGIRYSYMPGSGTHDIELLFSVNTNVF
jgi:hypothetical protein